MAVTVTAKQQEWWLCWGLRYWYVKMCHPGLNNDTVKPPVSDQQKCKDRWSLTGGGCLQESKHRVFLPKRGPGTSPLWEIIYYMKLSKSGYV